MYACCINYVDGMCEFYSQSMLALEYHDISILMVEFAQRL